MNKHIESLRLLSEWLLANDMKLPEGVIDPSDTAEYIQEQANVLGNYLTEHVLGPL